MTWPQTNTHKPRKHEKTQNPKPEAFRNLRLRLLGGGVVVGNIPSSNSTTFDVNSTSNQLDGTSTEPGIRTSSDPHNPISYHTNI